MKLLKWIAVGFAALVLIVFAVGNRQPIEVNLFPFGVVATLPLFVLFFASIMLGVLLSLIGSMWSKVKHFQHDRGYKKKIAALENELAATKIEKNISSTSGAAIVAKTNYLKKVS